MNASMPSRQDGCPSDLDLERALRGEPAFASALGHADACTSCTSRLAWMREAGDYFARRVLPATREQVVEALTGGPRWLKLPRAWRWSGALVAAAMVVLSVRFSLPSPGQPSGTPGINVKGTAAPATLPLQVYVEVEGKGRRLASGDVVHPGDGLRFVVEAPGREVYLLSVDTQGRVSRLVPGGTAKVPQTGIVPGGSVLDEVLGPERIFVVEAQRGIDVAEVESAITRAVAGEGASGVRALENLPIAAPHGTLLLEKVPR
jgi:hypothetical protein